MLLSRQRRGGISWVLFNIILRGIGGGVLSNIPLQYFAIQINRRYNICKLTEQAVISSKRLLTVKLFMVSPYIF